MKQQVGKRRRKAEKQKKRNKMILNTKDLIFKKRPAKKLVDLYVSPYITKGVISTNVVKLKLPTLMRIYLIINIS